MQPGKARVMSARALVEAALRGQLTEAQAQRLYRLGAEVNIGDDLLAIRPGASLSGLEVETHGDHRMAMSFALAGLKIPGVKIKNPRCVEKSFPDFFDRFGKL